MNSPHPLHIVKFYKIQNKKNINSKFFPAIFNAESSSGAHNLIFNFLEKVSSFWVARFYKKLKNNGILKKSAMTQKPGFFQRFELLIFSILILIIQITNVLIIWSVKLNSISLQFLKTRENHIIQTISKILIKTIKHK